MQQIIFFFIRNKNFLLFALLFLVAFFLTLNAHSYHKSKFVSSANFLSGGIYSVKNSITDYFDLRSQNELLTKENNRLRTLLVHGNDGKRSVHLDSLSFDPNFIFISSTVINNSYSKTKNYLTLNKGSKDSLKIDMGVL
ncbi:MAG: rod shape-determining protein MreC, partial [Bacteroidia bacterium]|nr:rod shape-determining protein MreC [Bacteroidia bacterium]